MSGERSIILCADDYAMSEGVSRGIVALARAGRISATSAMTTSPLWPAMAGSLKDVSDRVAVGLHLNLTWCAPLGAMPAFAPGGVLPPVGRVVRSSLPGRLPLIEIRGEIERQLDAFATVWGAPPDFIDGHQHVHALPGIRSALLAAATARGLAATTWLRDPADRSSSILRRGGAWPKALAVAVLARGFGAAARKAAFRTNQGFAGFSSFAPDADLAVEFGRFLEDPGLRHLVMCHPGKVCADEVLDGVVEARRRELDFLASDAFEKLLAKNGVKLLGTLPPERLSWPGRARP